jgi:hypothetical protein
MFLLLWLQTYVSMLDVTIETKYCLFYLQVSVCGAVKVEFIKQHF